MRATFLITSKVYFITLIDLKKKCVYLTKQGLFLRLRSGADIICFSTGQGVHIFLFIIVNDINYMYVATFFICMAKRWH